MAKRYDWNDGKGRVHSRPKRTGAQLEKAKERKRLADPSYFTQPATLGDVLREAGRADDLRYGPMQGQLDLQQRQIPAWFDQYRQTLQTPQQVQQTYQPVIAQQQATAQQSAAPTPGVDPNSAAGADDAQAAKAREALANLGTSVLLANQAADTTYFQGRQGVSQAAQIGAQTQNQQARTDLAGERGAFRDTYVADARDRERKYGLDVQHQTNENKAFGLDVAEARGVDPVTGKKLPPKDKKDVITSGPFAGYTKGEVRRMDPAKKERLRRRANRDKPGEPKYGVDADKWAKMSPGERKAAKDAWEAGDGKGNGKDTFGNTPKQRRAAQSSYQKAKTIANSVVQDGDSWRDVYELLIVQNSSIDSDIARAAAMAAVGKPLGPKMRARLEAMGVRLPRPKKKRKPGTSSGGGGGPEGTGQTTYNG